MRLQSAAATATITSMAKEANQRSGAGGCGTFSPGKLVIVSLANPREKFWGALLELSTAGLAVRGIDLLSFDDFASLVRTGTAVRANEAFFPIHRIERIEADLRSGDIPSIAEGFLRNTGKTATELFAVPRPMISLAEIPEPDRDLERGARINRATANWRSATRRMQKRGPESRKR